MTGAQARTQAPQGLDLERLADYLAHVRPGLLAPPLSAKLVEGGRSNLTYFVRDADGREVVVRRPPLAHVLATAHDMSREHRVLSALADTAVPVPRTELLCIDASVLDAPFYVMERIEGVPYRHRRELEPLGAPRVRHICQRMMAMLVDLHHIDPAEVGLADLGRPAGFLDRQITRWHRQLEQSCSRTLPGLAELHTGLAAHVRTESRGSIVHGDFRLDNLLFDESDAVVAVLDWEMATLGDPLTDVALLVAYAIEATQSPFRPGSAASAPGFLSPGELMSAYAAAAACPMDGFGFYLALAFYKIIGILEGIHFRMLAGKTVGITYQDAGARVAWLVEAGLNALGD